ncbi:MAG: glycosyltransferase [Candidatus Levybacteria bacterium]|nr:glycosyltransferase [Candidatus Levybacteria bacterium]
MKVALVYDRLNKWGGAESVLLALHKLFPSAPLYTSVYDRRKAPWAKVFDVRTSFLQKLPFTMNHELFAVLMPFAFESFSFDEYDLVISVTSEAAKGIVTKPKTRHICYCLTPTRYLWSGYDEYFKNPIFRILSKPVVWYLRFWDKIAATRPDVYIAISKEVQTRISKYYGRESEVVYPPVEAFSSLASSVQLGNKKLDANLLGAKRSYFLIVSRLVSYKKIDLAIKVFNKLKLQLKIIGIGAEMDRLKAMSGSTVEFLGNLTDKELVRYYSECRALIFPGLEDFGLTILEAQSFGKPVIAFSGGGALETIVDPSAGSGSATGIFFDEQTIESIEKAIKQFGNIKFDSEDCIEQAEKFSLNKFKELFLSKI